MQSINYPYVGITQLVPHGDIDHLTCLALKEDGTVVRIIYNPETGETTSEEVASI